MNKQQKNSVKKSFIWGFGTSLFTYTCLLTNGYDLLNSQYDAKSLQLELEMSSHQFTNSQLIEANKKITALTKNVSDLNDKLGAQKLKLKQTESQRDSYIRLIKELIKDKPDKAEILRLKQQIETLDKTIEEFAKEIVEKAEEIGNLKTALNDAFRQIDEAKQGIEIEKAIQSAIDKDRDSLEARIKELEESLKAKDGWISIYKQNTKKWQQKIVDLENQNSKWADLYKHWKCDTREIQKHSQLEIYGEYCTHPDGTFTIRGNVDVNSDWNKNMSKIFNAVKDTRR